MSYKKLVPKNLTKLREIHAQGMNLAEMSQEMGFSAATVRRLCKNMGLDTSLYRESRQTSEAIRRSVERIAILRELHAQGLTMAEIGQRMGNVSHQRIYQMCKKHGLDTSRDRLIKSIDPEIATKFREFRDQRLSLSEIGRKMGWSTYRVHSTCVKLGLDMFPWRRQIDSEKAAKLRELHSQGLTLVEISERMGRYSLLSIRRTCIALGLDVFRVCRRCHKPIEKTLNRIYCDECRDKHVCKMCGSTFSGRRTRKYCDKCRWIRGVAVTG